MKRSGDRETSPCRELVALIQEYVELQSTLLESLMCELGQRDWRYLTDVPQQGAVEHDQDLWAFTVHGTGIRFRSEGKIVDANRCIDQGSELFDAGRIVDYAESVGIAEVAYGGEVWKLDHETAPKILRLLARSGTILHRIDLPGEVYSAAQIAFPHA